MTSLMKERQLSVYQCAKESTVPYTTLLDIVKGKTRIEKCTAERDFKIEVKYLKNWISSANTRAASKNWSVFQQDFDWLMDEIDNGKTGKKTALFSFFNKKG